MASRDREIARLSVAMDANTSRYEEGMERMQRQLNRFERRQNSTLKTISNGFKVLGAAIAGLQFTSFIKSSIDAANHLGDLSTRLGISTEELSKLQYAAEVTGVGVGSLETALQRMTRRIATAAQGTGEAVGALQALNLSARDLAQLSPDQQFQLIADAMANVENQGQKVALAMKIFDTEGVALLQTMEGGAAALEQYGNEAERFGRVISAETAANAAAFNKQAIELKSNLQGVANVMIEHLLPVALEVSETLRSIFNPSDMERVVDLTEKIAEKQALLVGEQTLLQRITVDRNKVEEQLNRLLEERAAIIDRIASAQSGAPAPTLPVVGGADPIADQSSLQSLMAYADEAAEAVRRSVAEKEKEYARQRELLAANVDTLDLALMTEEERLEESYRRRTDMLEKALARGAVTEEKYLAVRAKLETKHAADMDKLEDQRAKGRLAKAQTYMGALSTLMTSQSGALVEIGRAAAITQATIDGIVAIQASLKLGGAAGFAAAAAMAVVTANNVAQIAGARAMGGPVGAGSTYLVGERGPELFTPGTSGNIVPNHELGGMNVTIVEDSSRAGQVTQSESGIEVAVAAVYNKLSRDLSQGVGMAHLLQRQYGLRRA